VAWPPAERSRGITLAELEIPNQLHEAGIKRVAAGEPMSRHTSWRIGGLADYFCVADSEGDLRAAIDVARTRRIPWLILGGGNNILVSDEGIEGLVILNRLRGLSIEQPLENGSLLACGAGVFFAKAAQFSARHGYTGLEWGIAIPGTVGGGVVNNAGAHNTEVSEALESADVIDAEGHRERLSPDDLAYRYRESGLKQARSDRARLVVTGCRFHIHPADAESALKRVEELRRHRLRTQPVKEASAGSTFKNPPGEYAGALIDRAGLKGHRIGGAQIAPLHANFILNVKNADASDVVALMRLAQERVNEQFGVRLEPEVQLVGRWPKSIVEGLHEGGEPEDRG
jgi:UDP-N-acetylmuramate dehydrogenase